MALHRREGRAAGGNANRLAVDDVLAKKCPDLADFLCATVWPDGTERLRGTLLIFTTDAGTFSACLNDKDAELTCFVTAESVARLLEAADKALAPGKGDWRAYRREKPAKKK